MRRTTLLVGLLALAGCHHDKYNLKANHPEEFVPPPDEARYNRPDESGYRQPAKRTVPAREGPSGVGGPRGGFGPGGSSL